MSFTKLQEALVEQTEAEISKMRAQHAAEYAETERAITERARQLEEEIIRTAEAAGVLEAQRLHQSAQLSARADILRVKQAELLAAQEETVQQILTWPTAEAHALVAALLDRIPEKQGTITPGAAHAALIRTLAGKRGFTVAEDEIADDGGFIFRGERTELNATVRRLVHELFRRHRTDLAALLYG